MEKIKPYIEKTPVTVILVAVNIIVFIITDMLGDIPVGDYSFRYIEYMGMMIPGFVVEEHEYYRLFTCLFLHGGIEHILNNMLLLFLVGQVLEKELGSVRFAIIYFVSGLCGSGYSLFSKISDGDYITGSIGASGAIFGLVGGMLVIIAMHKGRYKGITLRKAVFSAILALSMGFSTDGVDNAGHVGGFAGGVVITFILYTLHKSRAQSVDFEDEKNYTFR